MALCSYNGCKNDVGIAGQGDLCVCHVRGPKDETKFRQAIREQILNENYNFAGYIFLECNFSDKNLPRTTTFRDAIFTRHADFGSCRFNNVDFDNTVFEQGADFNNANFTGESCSFRKSHFKEIALFTTKNFNSSISFAEAIFENDVNFRDSVFKGNSTSFRGCTFKGKSTIFYGVTFDSKKLVFEGAKFVCPDTNIEGVCFETSRFNSLETTFIGLICEIKSIDFHDCTFEGIVSFNKSNFSETSLNFHNVTLNGDECSFEDVRFGVANFSRTIVKNRIRFESVAFSGSVDFENLRLSESSFFSLRRVSFPTRKKVEGCSNNSDGLVKIEFRNTIFPPLRTYFENISSGRTFKNASYDTLPTVCFDYCHLKDSYFIENNMVHFSFRHTMLTEIVFINNEWFSTNDTKDHRKNVLIDELRIKDMSFGEREVNRVTELYIQLKTAHDRNNDYVNSGYFYFNQMELTRKLYLLKLKGLPWEFTRFPKHAMNRFGLRLKSFFYYLYKVVAGYGQKPLWSFYSLIALLLFVFSPLYMVCGFNEHGKLVRYSIDFYNSDSIGTIYSDFLHAIVLSLSHAFPFRSYLSTTASLYTVNESVGGILLSWANTITLLIVIGLMLMGIRRHFRRY